MNEGVEIPHEAWRPRWWGIVFFVTAAVLMALIVAASWAADSRMTALRWVPGRIATLADLHPNLRTAIPFVPLAFLLVQGFHRLEFRWPLVWAVIVCASCLCLSELGQVFLPSRTADVKDLIWGGVGIAVGVIVARWRK